MAIIFDTQASSATVSITTNTHGMHYLYFNISGKDSQMFESPPPMIVIVKQNGNHSTHTHYQYFDKHEQKLGILKPGCCSKKNSVFSCPQNDLSLSFISSCSWETTRKTFGIIFSQNGDILLPMGVAGVQMHSQHPLLTLPIMPSACGECNSDCLFYNFTEEDVVDFIKAHALAKSFLQYSQQLIPNYVSLTTEHTDSYWNHPSFFSYDIIVDIAYREDLALIEHCENFDVLHEGLYAVLRYNDKLEFFYNGVRYHYVPDNEDRPLCFAISLCDGNHSPVYIAIPNENQEALEQVDAFKVCLWLHSFSSHCYYQFLLIDLQ